MENPAAPAPASQAPSNNQGSPEGQHGGEGQADGSQRAKPEAEAPKPRYHKVKVNGQERSVTDDDLIRAYSKVSAADERFQQATQMEKSARAFFEALEKDPMAILSDPRLPINKQELGIRWIKEKIEEELREPADPRDIDLKKTKTELERYKAQEAAQKKAEQDKQYQAVVSQRREAIAADLTKALDLSPFSKDPTVKAEVLREMASYMRICRQQGYDVTPQEIAAHIQSTHFNRYAALASAHSGEDLVNILGEAAVKKIREFDLQRLRSSRMPSQAPDVAQSWQPGSKTRREFVNPDDLKRRK